MTPLQVAILCNHQKAVGKGHDGAMEKLQEKLKDAKHQLKELHATGGSVKRPLSHRSRLSEMEVGARRTDLSASRAGHSSCAACLASVQAIIGRCPVDAGHACGLCCTAADG